MLIFGHITLAQLIAAIIPAVLGVVLGFAVEAIFLRQALRITSMTKWELDDIFVSSLRGLIFPWFIIGGFYFAIHPLPLTGAQVNLFNKSIQVITIVLLTLMAMRIGVALVKHLTKSAGGTIPSATLFSNITKILVTIGGVLMLMQTLGISITPMLTALGVGGLAVALALQDTLGNLFAGIQVLATRKIRPGDYISLDSKQEGYVTDITWRNTIIKALNNSFIIVPNSKIASSLVTNYHLPEKELSVSIQVGVAYGSDLKLVEKVTIETGREIMKTIPGGIEGFEPLIRFHTFGEYSVNFSVVLRCKEFVDQYLIKHEFIKRLHDAYMANGIEIPFPVHTVHLSRDNSTPSASDSNLINDKEPV